MLKTKTTAKSQQWNLNLRPRVGDSAEYNNATWVNLTGKNSEPGVGDDWELVFTQSSNQNQIEVFSIEDDWDFSGSRVFETFYRQDYTLNPLKESFVKKIPVITSGSSVNSRLINTFRIPSMCSLPNGDIFVAAEARVNTSSDEDDAEGYYAILSKGVVIKEGILIDKGSNNKVSNPNSVVLNNILYVFFGIFNTGGIIDSNTTNTTLYYTTSADNGQTFSNPIEFLSGDQSISSTFKYMTTPSKSIISPDGKIILPIWGKDFTSSTNRTDPEVYRCGIVIFDTINNTFTKKILPFPRIAEPVCYYDSEDNLIIDCRVLGSSDNLRKVYYSTNNGNTWLEHVSTNKPTSPVYVDLERHRSNVIRADIDTGLASSQRKNLSLYLGDQNNRNYTLLSKLTQDDDLIWGYTSLFKRNNRVYVLSEDRQPTSGLFIYQFNVLDDPFNNFFDSASPELSILYWLNPIETSLNTDKIFISTDSTAIDTYQSNGKIVMEDLITGSGSSESISTDGKFNDSTSSSRYIYFELEKANQGFSQFLIDDGIAPAFSSFSVRTSDQDNNDVRLKITREGITTFDQKISNESFDGAFKIKIEDANIPSDANANFATVYKWNGTQYVQLFQEKVEKINYYFRFFRGSSFVDGDTTSLLDIVVSNSDWTGKKPV